MLFSSFKVNKEIMALEQHLLPQVFTVENYINMNARFNFMRFFANSLLVTIVITLAVIYTSTICGFVLSKYKFKGRELLFGFVLSTMMIPWCVTIIPKYSMIQKYGWLDSYKALIIPAMFSGFGIFNMKQHIATLPDEILEAAYIDGASEFQTMVKIAVPLSKPIIATIGMFAGIAYWNDWNNGYIYLVQRTDLYSIQNLLNRLMQNINALTQNASQVGNVNQGLSEIPSVTVRMAMATLGILPIVVIYPFIQKNFVKGITLGGVKG